MAQDGRWDPNKNPKKEDVQRLKDGVSGNSAEGQGAQKKPALQETKAEPDVIGQPSVFASESGIEKAKN